MEFNPIYINFTIRDENGRIVHVGRFNFADFGERKACATRFNDCLLQGYEVRTVRAGV